MWRCRSRSSAIGGLTDEVDVTLGDLPAGVTLEAPVSVSGLGGLRGTLTLDITTDVTPGDASPATDRECRGRRSAGGRRPAVDLAPPVVGAPWPRITLRSGGTYDGSAAVRLAWSVTDDSSGVGTVELQRRTGVLGPGRQWCRHDAAPTRPWTRASGPTSGSGRATVCGNTSTSSNLPTRLVVRDSASDLIRWRGTWRTAPRSGATGRSVRRSGAADASATLTFTGRGVGIVAPQGPGRGKLDVTIDGRPVATVDLVATSVRPRRVVFASQSLSPGPHTLTVTTRKAGAELDAILVLE